MLVNSEVRETLTTMTIDAYAECKRETTAIKNLAKLVSGYCKDTAEYLLTTLADGELNANQKYDDCDYFVELETIEENERYYVAVRFAK